MHGRVKDLTGQIFGRLKAVRYVGQSTWRCICGCDNKVFYTKSFSLCSGAITNCGCVIKPRRKPPVPAVPHKGSLLCNGFKRCSDCLQDKSAKDFTKHTKYADKLYPYCRSCWYWKRLESTYGLTKEQFQDRLKSQANRCACCCAPFVDGHRDPVCDHNHDTGTFRALLCTRCNLVEGMTKDVESLLNILNYRSKYDGHILSRRLVEEIQRHLIQDRNAA